VNRGPLPSCIGNPGLGGNSIAFGVNEWGLAVGEAENTSADLSTTEDFCGFQAMGYSSSPAPCVPFLWKQGKMVPLKTLGGVNGVANQINSWGAIVPVDLSVQFGIVLIRVDRRAILNPQRIDSGRPKSSLSHMNTALHYGNPNLFRSDLLTGYGMDLGRQPVAEKPASETCLPCWPNGEQHRKSRF
jgi:uncharacterized membrane protein